MSLQSPFSNDQPVNMVKVDKAGKSSSRLKKKDMVLIILVVVFVITAVGLGYLYYRERQKSNDPAVTAGEDVRRLKEQVGRHILLPEGEPGIATIVDIEKLKKSNPEFYSNAKNGDKLLVYKSKAIIYDPQLDKIVNVAPIVNANSDTEETTPTSVPTPTPTPTPTPSS